MPTRHTFVEVWHCKQVLLRSPTIYFLFLFATSYSQKPDNFASSRQWKHCWEELGVLPSCSILSLNFDLPSMSSLPPPAPLACPHWSSTSPGPLLGARDLMVVANEGNMNLTVAAANSFTSFECQTDLFTPPIALRCIALRCIRPWTLCSAVASRRWDHRVLLLSALWIPSICVRRGLSNLGGLEDATRRTLLA